MKVARSTMVTAGVAAAAALAATGITYASAASAPVADAAQVAAVGAPAPRGGDSGQGKNNNNNGNGNGNSTENWSKGNEGKGNEGGEENEGGNHHRHGRIHINERSYSAHTEDCTTVLSGLGAKSLNIRNESDGTVEVFRGAVCDNGAPIATVGPHSSSFGVRPCPTEGIEVDDGIVASFRVVKHHRHDHDNDED